MGPSEDRDRSQSWDSLNSMGSPRQSGTAALPFSSRMWQPMAPCPFCAHTHTHTFTWCSQACVPQQPGNSLQSCCCISCHALSDCELSSSFLGPNTGGTRSSSSETDVRTNSSKQKQQDIVQGDFLPETLFLGFRSTNPE